MTTDPLAPVGETGPVSEGLPPTAPMGRSAGRHHAGIAGQYLVLGLLAMIVILPIVFTLIQALSPPIEYIKAGKPLHPVKVDWNDRTWFTGGFISLMARTAAALAYFSLLQKVGSGVSWKQRKELWTPLRTFSVMGGTVALMVVMGPLFQSLHHADGKSQGWAGLALLVITVTQIPGYLDPERRAAWVAVLNSFVVALIAITATVVFTGAAVWNQAWTTGNLGPSMARSLIMAIAITVLQVTTSVMAAYAFVFLRFPLKRTIFLLFMATLLLPLEVTLVGNVALIRQLGWINSYQALILPFAASALGIFLIRQGFRGIPPEIQDATRLDGYGHFAFLTKFAVPLSKPVVASFTVIAALQAWNQYLWPRTVIENDSLNTLQIQLRTNIGANIANANVTIAGALLAAIPVVIVLIAFQRAIVRGLTAGAVK